MKVTFGGGGVDGNGNAYTLPTHTEEVPEDFFVKAWAALSKVGAPTYIATHPWLLEVFKEAAESDNRRHNKESDKAPIHETFAEVDLTDKPDRP